MNIGTLEGNDARLCAMFRYLKIVLAGLSKLVILIASFQRNIGT